ncbi:helix-turn-helix domain-containing protein [Candidatus Parcubacteria bacterium]|nr:helix-turn-helix domain-containing protein [Candidatus Parcubacteria bacterium]
MAKKTPKIDYPDSISSKPKRKKTKPKKEITTILTEQVKNPLWISISTAAQLGGVNNKTIRRAVQAKKIRYKITGNRYFVDFSSIIRYLHKNTKLRNKARKYGLEQYIVKWRE